MGKEIIFYYDIICPYAYLASKLVSDLAKRNGAKLLWRPVLLGGIYKDTKLETMNVPDNKMILTYGNQKRKILAQDLAMLYSRYKVPISTYTVPDIRTLNAMRVVASTPNEHGKLRERLTHTLFDAIWLHQKDVSDINTLQELINSVDYDINVQSLVDDKSHPSRQILIDNTKESVKRGTFGVPSIWVNNRLYFGGDRMFMVERELGNKVAKPDQLLSKPLPGIKKAKLTFYFDFGSPWAYLGLKQIPSLIKSVSPVVVDIELVPIVVGGLFKEIGTPGVPIQNMGENKRNYMFKDFSDFLKYYQISNFKCSSHFPLNTILPLRLAVANPDMKMIERLFDATWCEDKDISKEAVLSDVLSQYDLQSLLQRARQDDVKAQLRSNTTRALDAGICGVPSFQVNDGPVVFGQDRMNIVADMLRGWKFEPGEFVKNSKL